ncbi:hypothetical protein F5884DRAFT_813498 [Xylogone sp. PMI_703]|nr:hypothetical protein F5884DRAFT_813498 [Xylogone sp. PMI_703]
MEMESLLQKHSSIEIALLIEALRLILDKNDSHEIYKLSRRLRPYRIKLEPSSYDGSTLSRAILVLEDEDESTNRSYNGLGGNAFFADRDPRIDARQESGILSPQSENVGQDIAPGYSYESEDFVHLNSQIEFITLRPSNDTSQTPDIGYSISSIQNYQDHISNTAWSLQFCEYLGQTSWNDATLSTLTSSTVPDVGTGSDIMVSGSERYAVPNTGHRIPDNTNEIILPRPLLSQHIPNTLSLTDGFQFTSKINEMLGQRVEDVLPKTMISTLRAATRDVIRSDTKEFLATNLPRWKQYGLWYHAEVSNPTVKMSSYKALESAYSCVCQLEM